MVLHRVTQGECLASIAKHYGFADWRAVYNHPENSDFRKRRPDPNVILPGDVIFICDMERRSESVPTEQHHRFKVKRSQTLLRLVLLNEQHEAQATVRYRLEVEDETFEGTTDSEGLIEHPITADAQQCFLTVWLPPRQELSEEEPVNVDYVDGQQSSETSESGGGAGSSAPAQADEQPFEWDLEIGHLDPVEALTGVQERLANLGFNPGPIDGIRGPLTNFAVRRFQQAHGLAVDEIPGPQTQAKLKELYGC
jgi:N-acetylmuramoyl-L-alanine amidase